MSKQRFKKVQKFVLMTSFVLMMSSCIPYNTILNYSENEIIPEDPQKITNYSPITVESNDVLSISVSSLDSEAASVFNGSNGGYLVDENGNVDFPLVGSIELADLTIAEAKIKVLSAIDTFFVQAPIVNVKLVNFKINVNGEVNSPGNILVPNERISLIDAISLAGDFTSYSSREDILLIREEKGKRIFQKLNFNNLDILESPYFYLKQNDVIYVKPRKRKTGTIRGTSDRLIPYASVTLSLTVLFITIFNIR